MLFTSVVASQGMAPSLQFRENGNLTDIPAALNNVNIVGTQSKSSMATDLKRSYFHLLMAANATGTRQHLKAGNNPFLSVMDNVPQEVAIQLPPIVINMPTDKNQAIKTKLAEAGFIREDHGDQPMMKGNADADMIKWLTQKGVNTDVRCPIGTTNICGWHSANVINRLIYWAINSLQEPAFIDEDHQATESSIRLSCHSVDAKTKGTGENERTSIPLEQSKVTAFPLFAEWKLVLDKPSSMPEAMGTVLPYFPGLTLYDSDYLFNIIIRLFKYSLGPSAESANAVLRVLKTGLPSLGRSSTGLAQSHVLFCIDLALSTGCGLSLIRDGTSYRGAVLVGFNYQIHKGLGVTNPSTRSTVVEEIKGLMGHQVAIKELAELLSARPLNESTTEKEVKQEVSTDDLVTARATHNIIIQRKLDNDFNKAVTDIMKRISFPQVYWLPDLQRMEQVLESISTNSPLPDDAPFPYRTSHVFSRDRITTTLSAFGLRVPSFRAASGPEIKLVKPTGANDAVKAAKIQEWMKSLSPTLDGIPVYILPLEEAKAEWMRLRQSGALRMVFKKGRISGNPAKIFTKDEGVNIAVAISKIYAISATDNKKRGREDEKKKETKDQDEDGRPSKKSKKEERVLTDFLLGRSADIDGSGSEDEQMSEDDGAW